MDTRLVIGLSSDEVAGEVRAALVRVGGVGLDSTVECLASATVPMDRTVSITAGSAAPGSNASDSIASDAGFRIAQQFFEAIRAVSERAAASLDQILLLGFNGTPDSPSETHAALVAARLAELSGTTTVSGFSLRDRAAGGRGGDRKSVV